MFSCQVLGLTSAVNKVHSQLTVLYSEKYHTDCPMIYLLDFGVHLQIEV